MIQDSQNPIIAEVVNLRERVKEAEAALRQLGGPCRCGMGMGNPMVKDRLPGCKKARAYFEKWR